MVNLNDVANKAATEISGVVGTPLTEVECDQIASIVSKAMKGAIMEASVQHSTVCNQCLIHDQDMAHKVRDELERKKISLIANLSSLR